VKITRPIIMMDMAIAIGIQIIQAFIMLSV